jgi:hypothetical protein
VPILLEDISNLINHSKRKQNMKGGKLKPGTRLRCIKDRINGVVSFKKGNTYTVMTDMGHLEDDSFHFIVLSDAVLTECFRFFSNKRGRNEKMG